MAYTRYMIADYGPSKAGLLTVGYQFFTTLNVADGARITAGVVDLGQGAYGALVAVSADAFAGRVRWDTGEAAASIAYLSEEINPDSATTEIYRQAQFGAGKSGLSTVVYQFRDTNELSAFGAPVSAGVQEWEQGAYGALTTQVEGFQGSIRWSTGGASPVYAIDSINEVVPAFALSAVAAAMRDLWRELTNEKTASVVPDAVVDQYINEGLKILNRMIGYHILTDTTSVALVDGTQEYTLPDTFVEMLWVEHNGRELGKGSVPKWRTDQNELWRTEPSGTPTQYAVYGRKLVLRAKPNAAAVAAAGTLTLRHISTPAGFTTNGPALLGTQDTSCPVLKAVSLWFESINGRDATLAAQWHQTFEAEAARIRANYDERGVAR